MFIVFLYKTRGDAVGGVHGKSFLKPLGLTLVMLSPTQQTFAENTLKTYFEKTMTLENI